MYSCRIRLFRVLSVAVSLAKNTKITDPVSVIFIFEALKARLYPLLMCIVHKIKGFYLYKVTIDNMR